MPDKELIKKKFQKSISTYCNNASVQYEIAKKLATFISGKYKNVLEIGSYSGFLTQEVLKNIEFENYFAIDIINSYEYIKKLNPNINFKIADIEQIELKEKYDLIISSSSLQWCEDFSSVIKKLKSHLTQNGRIIISIFGKKNLYQIKNIFNVSLNYPDIEEIKQLFSDNVKIFEEIKTIKFQSPKDVLRHLKYTGVNSFNKTYSFFEIKENMKKLEEIYKNELTYNPLYIID